MEFYFTEGSRDQFGMQNITSVECVSSTRVRQLQQGVCEVHGHQATGNPYCGQQRFAAR